MLLFPFPTHPLQGNGRGERIRTSDSCVPNAVLYQAELHPEPATPDAADLALLISTTALSPQSLTILSERPGIG